MKRGECLTKRAPDSEKAISIWTIVVPGDAKETSILFRRHVINSPTLSISYNRGKTGK